MTEVWAWYSDRERIDYCKQCLKSKSADGEDPPCAGCSYGRAPELMDANAEAWELWCSVNTQWRAGGMGIVGLDYPAVYLEAARLEIEVTNCVMGKIRALERAVLQEVTDDRGQRTEKKIRPS